MKIFENKIFQLLDSPISKMGYELSGCEYIAQGRNSILRLYVDKEGGINLDDCKEVMTFVNPLLDVEDLIQGKYNLEISSPGENRPLFSIEHFKRYIGREIQVKLAIPRDGRRNFKGELMNVNEKEVTISVDGKDISLELEMIDKANLVAKFT